MEKRSLFASVLLLFLLPLVSAFGYGYGSFYPEQILNSEWFRFIIVFVFFYAVLFFAAKKVFDKDKGVAVVVAMVLSVAISYALVVRRYLDFYIDSAMLDLFVLLGFLIVIGLLFRFMYVHISPKVSALIIFLLWLGIYLFYNSSHPSLYALPDSLLTVLELLSTPLAGIIAAIATLLLLFKKSEPQKHHKEH